jgi:DNA-binding FadR family transcriptional regulator
MNWYQVDRRSRAIERLNALLSEPQVRDGDRLPPERMLAVQLGCSRSALREGLEVLEAEGRVWRHVGKGTFAGPRPIDTAAINLSLASATSPEEVLESRLTLEPMLARLASVRASAAEIDNMEHLLKKSEAARDAKVWELWDLALHRAVAEAARNKLLLAVFDAINAMRGMAEWEQLRLASLSPELLATYRGQHRKYVDAIRARLPGRAEEAMRTHLQTVGTTLLGSRFDRPGTARPGDSANG